jgi:sugar phosphate isomerase/epimerase
MRALLVRALTLGVFAITGTGARADDGPLPVNPFFVLDNGVGRGTWTPEQQAQAMKDLGTAGMSYNDVDRPETVARWQQELHRRGLKLFALYFYTYPDRPDSQRYPAHLRDTIQQLKGSETVLWMCLRETRDGKKTGYDGACVAMVKQVSDWCREAGLKVAIYPHTGFYVATTEEALRIADRVDRPDVGVTVNLCHELMQQHQDRLPEIVRKAAPRLALVSINGADRDGKPGGFILRLDQGSYDVYGFLKLLRSTGYRGPIGLQCYSVPGDIRDNLEKSVAAWKAYERRLAREPAP